MIIEIEYDARQDVEAKYTTPILWCLFCLGCLSPILDSRGAPNGRVNFKEDAAQEVRRRDEIVTIEADKIDVSVSTPAAGCITAACERGECGDGLARISSKSESDNPFHPRQGLSPILIYWPCNAPLLSSRPPHSQARSISSEYQ